MPNGLKQRLLPLAGAAIMTVAAAAMITWTRVGRRSRMEHVSVADAIVVFGAAAGPSGPSPELAARLDHAAALYYRGLAPLILCSGGRSQGVSEPQAMRGALLRRGVPLDAIMIDEGGTSTRRTISGARREGRGRWRCVLLVSSPYHMHRIVSEAHRQGLDCIPCPALAMPGTRRSAGSVRQHAREVAAVWWYAISAPLFRPRAG